MSSLTFQYIKSLLRCIELNSNVDSDLRKKSLNCTLLSPVIITNDDVDDDDDDDGGNNDDNDDDDTQKNNKLKLRPKFSLFPVFFTE